MNHLKNNKKIILILAICILILIIFLTVQFNGNAIKDNQGDLNNTLQNEPDTLEDELISKYGTNFYDHLDVQYYDDKAEIKTYDGAVTVSLTWMNEGNATYVKEPEFGELDIFTYKYNMISASYSNVKIRDVDEYINQIKEMGFNQVIIDNKNKKNDYYNYSSKNGEGVIFTLNYENGCMYFEVCNE